MAGRNGEEREILRERGKKGDTGTGHQSSFKDDRTPPSGSANEEEVKRVSEEESSVFELGKRKRTGRKKTNKRANERTAHNEKIPKA